jgi:hypothetical protein
LRGLRRLHRFLILTRRCQSRAGEK